MIGHANIETTPRKTITGNATFGELEKRQNIVTDSLDINLDNIDQLRDRIRSEIKANSDLIFKGDMTILESTEKMRELTHDVLTQIANEFAKSLNVDVSSLPFALFVFGATARNQMLPNSDLDIAIIYTENCPEEVKRTLSEIVNSLPFEDETDIAHWNSIEGIKKENCPSIMEYNKVVEAKFVVGNLSLAKSRDELVANQDSTRDKEKRFITQFNILHRYTYGSKRTEHGPDLKYDFGGSRDIIFLDWYYLIRTSQSDHTRDVSDEKPTSYLCLDLLLSDGVISPEDYVELQKAIELILLVKFALLHESLAHGDSKLFCVNDRTFGICYQDIAGIMKKKGVNNVDEFNYLYGKAKNKLHEVTIKLYEIVSASDAEISEMWRLAKSKQILDDEVREILERASWHELIPFAIASSSPEILAFIVEKFGQREGYEYILRIISENLHTTDIIKQDLLRSRLDRRFKRKIDEDTVGNK